MENEITIKLTAAELEIVSRVLRAANDVMMSETAGEWVADYESFILDLDDNEYSALQTAIGKI